MTDYASIQQQCEDFIKHVCDKEPGTTPPSLVMNNAYVACLFSMAGRRASLMKMNTVELEYQVLVAAFSQTEGLDGLNADQNLSSQRRLALHNALKVWSDRWAAELRRRRSVLKKNVSLLAAAKLQEHIDATDGVTVARKFLCDDATRKRALAPLDQNVPERGEVDEVAKFKAERERLECKVHLLEQELAVQQRHFISLMKKTERDVSKVFEEKLVSLPACFSYVVGSSLESNVNCHAEAGRGGAEVAPAKN